MPSYNLDACNGNNTPLEPLNVEFELILKNSEGETLDKVTETGMLVEHRGPGRGYILVLRQPRGVRENYIIKWKIYKRRFLFKSSWVKFKFSLNDLTLSDEYLRQNNWYIPIPSQYVKNGGSIHIRFMRKPKRLESVQEELKKSRYRAIAAGGV